MTDRLASYGAALNLLGVVGKRETGRWPNNRAENSHQPFRRRERAMLRFRLMRSLQKFAVLHGYIHNRFNPADFQGPPRRRPYRVARLIDLAVPVG